MAISNERRAARVFVLRHAAGWLRDLEDTELTVGPNGERDELACQESIKLAERLEAMADKLERKS